MTTQTEAGNEFDELLEDSSEDTDTLKKVRARAREEAKLRKAAQAERDELLADRKATREAKLTDAVNGKGVPQVAVDALLAQVEDLSNEEFDDVLGQFGGLAAPATDGSEAPATETPVVNPADLGDAVAAAANGETAIDPIAALRGAKSKEELNALAREQLRPHGLA